MQPRKKQKRLQKAIIILFKKQKSKPKHLQEYKSWANSGGGF